MKTSTTETRGTWQLRHLLRELPHKENVRRHRLRHRQLEADRCRLRRRGRARVRCPRDGRGEACVRHWTANAAAATASLKLAAAGAGCAGEDGHAAPPDAGMAVTGAVGAIITYFYIIFTFLITDFNLILA